MTKQGKVRTLPPYFSFNFQNIYSIYSTNSRNRVTYLILNILLVIFGPNVILILLFSTHAIFFMLSFFLFSFFLWLLFSQISHFDQLCLHLIILLLNHESWKAHRSYCYISWLGFAMPHLSHWSRGPITTHYWGRIGKRAESFPRRNCPCSGPKRSPRTRIGRKRKRDWMRNKWPRCIISFSGHIMDMEKLCLSEDIKLHRER